MEVGPLNSIPPKVQGPKEGRQGRTGKVTSEKNRLTANRSKARKVSGDTADIKPRDTDLKELQGKIALGNTTKQVLLVIIKGIKAIEAGADAAKTKDKIDKAVKTKFSGEPVFNGKTLSYKSANGETVKLKVPDEKQVSKWVITSIKDAIKGKTKVSKAYKDLSKFVNSFTSFTNKAKGDVKNIVGISNKGASRSRTADVNAVKRSLKQVFNRLDKIDKFSSVKEMAGKTITLLK